MSDHNTSYEVRNITSSNAHKYKSSSQDKYIDPDQSVKILDLAKKLENTPLGWNINNALALKITKDEIDDLLDSLYILKSSKSRVHELRPLLKGIIEGYLESSESFEYLTAQHRNVLKFIHTGCWYNIKIAMQSAFLLYTLGPFAINGGPTCYVDVDHHDYRIQVNEFCRHIHEFYLQRGLSGDLKKQNDLMSDCFPALGDELRRIIWRNQNKQ